MIEKLISMRKVVLQQVEEIRILKTVIEKRIADHEAGAPVEKEPRLEVGNLFSAF